MSVHFQALAIVFGSLGALHLVLRWLGTRGEVRRRSLRVLETCALGARKRVHLVEVEGERLLLAASEAGITLLQTLPERKAPASSESETPTPRPPARGRLRRVARASSAALLGGLLLAFFDPGAAAAESAPSLVISLEGTGEDGRLSPALEMLALLTIVSIAPSILLMATCFTRVVIVLAFVRQAIGVQHLPPNQVLIGLALFVTVFVMAPLGQQIRVEAYQPYVAQEISLEEASERGLAPVRSFLLQHTREADLALFLELAGDEPPEELDDVSTSTLLPAYLVSELHTAFEIGFMIFLPFLVIDLVVSSMLISMGMIVLPPIVVALPFKIMLFVLADGWNLVLGSLVAGLR